jgi:4-hydroxy-3-polyprenylbenzoate decarboxylase
LDQILAKLSRQAREPEAAKTPARGANSSDLDTWLEKVEALGELKRITAEVDPDLEAATVTYLVGLEKSPALLFENVKGHPGHKALYNMIGCNLSRFCLMIGEEPVDHPLKAVQALQKKLGRKMPPEVPPEQAICNQNIVRATRSTSACSRRSGCGRSTAADISAPRTPW